MSNLKEMLETVHMCGEQFSPSMQTTPTSAKAAHSLHTFPERTNGAVYQLSTSGPTASPGYTLVHQPQSSITVRQTTAGSASLPPRTLPTQATKKSETNSINVIDDNGLKENIVQMAVTKPVARCAKMSNGKSIVFSRCVSNLAEYFPQKSRKGVHIFGNNCIRCGNNGLYVLLEYIQINPYRQSHIQTDRLTNRKTDRQIERQTD